MLKKLASLWKKTLAKSNAKLKIDAEFTRPGVEMFLDMFKDEVEAIDEDPPIKFKWK